MYAEDIQKSVSREVAVRISFLLVLFNIHLISLTGCALINKPKKDLSVPHGIPQIDIYKTIDIKRRNLERSIIIYGVFVSEKQQLLSFKNATGYLKALYVKNGDVVQKGTLLAELDTDSIMAAIRCSITRQVHPDSAVFILVEGLFIDIYLPQIV